MKKTSLVALLALMLAAHTNSQSAVVYRLNFDSTSGVVVPGPGDVVPAGASSVVGDSTVIAASTPAGLQGGNVLSQTLGAAWPNKQGVQFTGGPIVQNAWTIEAVVKPDLSGCAYGLETISYIYNSYTYDQLDMGDVSLSVDQNTGILTFSPWGATIFGRITAPTPLQSGQWYHIAAVIRKGLPQQTELWINGSLEGTGGYPATWETQGQYRIPSHFRIGGWDHAATGRNWQGQVDSFVISDTALAIGSFVLLSEPLPSLYGRVNLDGYVGDKSSIGLVIQFRSPGSAVPQFTEKVFLDGDGDYSVPIVTPGTYGLAFKTAYSLMEVVPNVTTPTARVDVALTNGNMDGDNEVTTTDLSAVLMNPNAQGDE